jgi:hypothetical protein
MQGLPPFAQSQRTSNFQPNWHPALVGYKKFAIDDLKGLLSMTAVLKPLATAAATVATVWALSATPLHAQPAELEGVKLAPTVQVANAPLVLNGAGLRTRAFFKVYVAALYGPQKTTDAAALLAQQGPRRVVITLLRTVDADTFATALNDGLRDNHTEAQLAPLAPQVTALLATVRNVGEAKKGDVIHFDFDPASGTQVHVNGQKRGTPLPGGDFFTAMLRIWVGEKPADVGLKKGLLGG